jgi:hypothetical protein
MSITASIPMAVRSGGDSWHRGESPDAAAQASNTMSKARPRRGKDGRVEAVALVHSELETGGPHASLIKG